MSCDLSALDLAAIWIDGIHIDEHVVLIGPLPTPFSCTSLGVAYEAGTARIRLVPPGGGEPAQQSGCAVVIPADTIHVKIVNPGHE